MKGFEGIHKNYRDQLVKVKVRGEKRWNSVPRVNMLFAAFGYGK